MRFETVKQNEREEMRLAILQIIYQDDNYSLQGLTNIVEALKVWGIKGPIEEIRRAILYLEKKGFLALEGNTDPIMSLTADGIDLCEGNLLSPPGIAISEHRK